MEAVDRIGKARVQLNRMYPFFGYLTMGLDEQEFSDSQKKGMKSQGQRPTLAVSEDKDLFYSSEFVSELSDEQLERTLVHEVLHLVLNHHERLDKLINKNKGDQRAGNLAADVKVNHVLWEEGIPLASPESEDEETVTINRNGDCDLSNMGVPVVIEDIGDKSLEFIYKLIVEALPDEQDEGQLCDRDGSGSGSSDSGSDSEDEEDDCDSELDVLGSEGSFDNHVIKQGENNFEEEYNDFEETMSKASQQVEPGDLPQPIDERLDDISKGEEIEWQQVLQRKVSGSMVTDYDWMSPSRKGRASGHYLPSPKKQGLELVVVVDTSGSVSKENLLNYLGEVQNICSQFSNVTVTLIQHTTRVTDTETFEFARSSDFESIDVKGRGGTDHKPVFEKIDSMSKEPDQVVLFSDCESEFPDAAPDYDVLWAVDNKFKSESDILDMIPFGRVEFIEG